MAGSRARNVTLIVVIVALAAGCGRFRGITERGTVREDGQTDTQRIVNEDLERNAAGTRRQSSLLDLLSNRDDPNTTVEVNKYIWNATLDVLSFLPIEAADPFSGVIVYGYGTPPGGGRAYKATVFIKDPALDARSLTVAIQTRGGAASTETVRAVEDAILTRARQLRVADANL